MKEKNNRKKHTQKSKAPMQPQPKKYREAIIKIRPDAQVKIDAQTGEVSDIEMVQFLRDLTQHFAKAVIQDAKEVVGDSEEEQAAYIDWRIEQSGLRG